jgi:hypothetical protein
MSLFPNFNNRLTLELDQVSLLMSASMSQAMVHSHSIKLSFFKFLMFTLLKKGPLCLHALQ